MTPFEKLEIEMQRLLGMINDTCIARMVRFIEQGAKFDVNIQNGKNDSLIIVIQKNNKK